MRILAIETSCDETSASVIEKKKDEYFAHVLSLVTSTSLPEHAATGGIIPEKAARQQLEYMLPVAESALKEFSEKDTRKTLQEDIDAIAVTQGPGLIGSLLVGVECAKALSYIFEKPLIPVNHLLAHLYANFISDISKVENEKLKTKQIQFPFIGLIVSGGHTDLLLFQNHAEFEWLGGTRDDAVGEALDKIGRRLGLSYPGGPEIEKRASQIKYPKLTFKSPLLHSQDFDFSYSGLKTAVLYLIQDLGGLEKLDKKTISQIALEFENAAIEPLIYKTLKAIKKYKIKTVVVGGGVACNTHLQRELIKVVKQDLATSKIKLLFPQKEFTGDNSLMIGIAGYLQYIKNKKKVPKMDTIKATGNLKL